MPPSLSCLSFGMYKYDFCFLCLLSVSIHIVPLPVLYPWLFVVNDQVLLFLLLKFGLPALSLKCFCLAFMYAFLAFMSERLSALRRYGYCCM